MAQVVRECIAVAWRMANDQAEDEQQLASFSMARPLATNCAFNDRLKYTRRFKNVRGCSELDVVFIDMEQLLKDGREAVHRFDQHDPH